jgi:Leucine-rich repeat (LRR) protein
MRQVRDNCDFLKNLIVDGNPSIKHN